MYSAIGIHPTFKRGNYVLLLPPCSIPDNVQVDSSFYCDLRTPSLVNTRLFSGELRDFPLVSTSSGKSSLLP